MNDKFINLIYMEISNQIKLNNLIKYLFLFFGFCLLSIALVNNHENINNFAALFTLISIPLAMINLANMIFKEDMNDGTIELLMIIFSPLQITLAKFISLSACTSLAFATMLPITCILYNIELSLALLMFISGIVLCLATSGLICLISAIQCYFKSNTNFISVLIMPLIIPSIILIGIAMQANQANNYLGFLYGINLILTPLCIYLTSYLIENIYNI